MANQRPSKIRSCSSAQFRGALMSLAETFRSSFAKFFSRPLFAYGLFHMFRAMTANGQDLQHLLP